MARFNTAGARPTGRSKTVVTGAAVNSEGGNGFALSTLGELYGLAVVNFVGQKTFYEDGGDRDDRYNGLVENVATGQWEWLRGMLPWLRSEANMRTASLTAAAHAVHARLAAGAYDGNDILIDSVIQRGDEIAEFLAYWQATFGEPLHACRSLPKAVRRGLEMAIRRLYTERNVLKWDSSARGLRMADVIDVIHPKPVDAAQAALFKYLLDERHHRDGNADSVPLIAARKAWYAASDAVKVASLRDGSAFKQAGLTWENALSELKERLGERAVWDAMAPHLPYMAALRNLRNMDEAGISASQARKLADRLADPAEVARSRQLPYRFLSAYLEAPSDRWKQALEDAMNLSLPSVPELPGRTLVLVDTSASMDSLSYSAKSKVTPAMAAGLFGAVLAQRNPGRVDLFGFADGVFEHRVRRGQGALSAAKELVARIGEVGHGTEMTASVRKTFKGHDRIFLISDMQCFADPAGIGFSDGFRGSDPVPVPDGVKVYGVNLGGNAVTAVDSRVRNRFEFAGLTDAVFGQVLALEAGYDEKWPWLH
jgi:hypothetical protein